jgi:hypothetical protein
MYSDNGQVGNLYVFSNVKEEKPKIQRDYINIDFAISINYIEVLLATTIKVLTFSSCITLGDFLGVSCRRMTFHSQGP